MEYYFYIKSLHIIFVVTWFAGLFYTPRLFIYFIDASKKKNPDKNILMEQFKTMIYRLWYIIAWPSSILATVFGVWLLILVPQWIGESWMIVKLGFVVILIFYHLKTHFIHDIARQITGYYYNVQADFRFAGQNRRLILNCWRISSIRLKS